MKIRGILAVVAACSMPQFAAAGSYVLPEGVLICDTAAKYDQQMERAASGNYSAVPGCGINPRPVVVELVDFSALGGTEVYVPSIQGTIYTDGSALE